MRFRFHYTFAHLLQPNHPTLHVQIVKLLQTLEKATLAAPVKQAVTEGLLVCMYLCMSYHALQS